MSMCRQFVRSLRKQIGFAGQLIRVHRWLLKAERCAFGLGI
jgi:hypothetical protein